MRKFDFTSPMGICNSRVICIKFSSNSDGNDLLAMISDENGYEYYRFDSSSLRKIDSPEDFVIVNSPFGVVNRFKLFIVIVGECSR